MNVFEDLIEELKDENLLESTVNEKSESENYFEVSPPPAQSKKHNSSKEKSTAHNYEKIKSPEKTEVSDNKFSAELFSDEEQTQLKENIELPESSFPLDETPVSPHVSEQAEIYSQLIQDNTPFSEVIKLEEELQNLDAHSGQAHFNESKGEGREDYEVPVDFEGMEFPQFPEFPEYELLNKSVVNDELFYRRRANEEVTSLQIVEHIISAIEKEHMKIVPQSYNDLPVSMALHDFLKSGGDPNSNEHAEAEFKLMQETEKWYSALAQRDKNITVGDLRRYMENARPALSSQALISLARFYRNSPFSENVRTKFDLVVTKLVTKENWNDTRTNLFNREELIKHFEGLYADWSSIPLYENNQDDSDVLIGVLKFEDFIQEVNGVQTLDELVKNEFFSRVKSFKESTSEKFFAPLLVSAAVECNVVVGNKYVELVNLEKMTKKPAEIEEKYNFLLDQPVSETVSKTLKLVEILKEKKEPAKPLVKEKVNVVKEETVYEKNPNTTEKSTVPNYKKKTVKSGFKVNKWLAGVVVSALLCVGGLYTWAEFMTPQMKPAPNVKKVSLENSSLKEYFKTARINRETLFLVTLDNWEKLSKEVKQDVLKKTLAEGRDKGYNKIHVINSEGKPVGFASDAEISIEPS